MIDILHYFRKGAGMKSDIFTYEVIAKDMQNIFNRDIDINKLYDSTVLISGATGMLASYFVIYLIWLNEFHGANIKIIALIRNEKKAKSIFGKYYDSKYFNALFDDICAPLSINSNVDYIVHAASLASPQYYTNYPIEVAAPNALGTYYLLNLAKEKHVKGFLYFSSGDVYGKMPLGIGCFSENAMGITDPLEYHSCYGESKRMGETWCASFYRQHKVPICIARIAHTYGPLMDIENDPRVFASFMKCLIENKDIVMLSDGTAKRPFCYIDDAIAAFIFILINGTPGEAYNMSNTEQFISIRSLAKKILSLDKSGKLKLVIRQRDRDDNYLENTSNKDNCLSGDKLQRLGWKCEFDVVNGFKHVFEHQMELRNEQKLC